MIIIAYVKFFRAKLEIIMLATESSVEVEYPLTVNSNLHIYVFVVTALNINNDLWCSDLVCGGVGCLISSGGVSDSGSMC